MVKWDDDDGTPVKRPKHTGSKRRQDVKNCQTKIHNMILDTDLQLVVVPLECPAMSDVVLRMPRAGGTTPSSAWVRGTELARVETRRR